MTTGLVLQELLRGFAGPRARRDIIERFSVLPLVYPDRQDHIEGQICATAAAVPAFKSERSMRCWRSFAYAMT